MPQKCAPIGIRDHVQRIERGISRSICWSGGSGRVRPVHKEYAPGMRAKVEVMTGCVEPREEAD